MHRLWFLCLVVWTLGGCVAYEPAPLVPTQNLAPSLSGAGGRPRARLDSVAALDRLVLADNPDLKAARARLGISQAQIVQAGLLPNPQVSASYPFYVGGAAGVDAFGLGLAQDLRSIILRPAKREAATNAAAEIRASLLWQEWQTIGKARLLYVDILLGEEAAKVLGRNRKLLADRFRRTAVSIDQGNGTLATLTPDLVASSDVQKLDDELARLQLNRRHQLNALIGLSPDAPLHLSGNLRVPSLPGDAVRRDLATLATRRPDLVALQFGYRSQDAKLRQAVLAQFPNLVVSLFGGRDSSAVYSLGPQATFDLPIFDQNEGAIAIESATRGALEAEFQARLAAATGEVGALLAEQALLRRQLDALEPRLQQARTIAGKTEAAFAQGNFDERAYVDVEVAVLGQEQQKIALRQALLEGQVALATLTGAGLPRITLGAEPPPADPFGLLRAVSR